MISDCRTAGSAPGAADDRRISGSDTRRPLRLQPSTGSWPRSFRDLTDALPSLGAGGPRQRLAVVVDDANAERLRISAPRPVRVDLSSAPMPTRRGVPCRCCAAPAAPRSTVRGGQQPSGGLHRRRRSRDYCWSARDLSIPLAAIGGADQQRSPFGRVVEARLAGSVRWPSTIVLRSVPQLLRRSLWSVGQHLPENALSLLPLLAVAAAPIVTPTGRRAPRKGPPFGMLIFDGPFRGCHIPRCTSATRYGAFGTIVGVLTGRSSTAPPLELLLRFVDLAPCTSAARGRCPRRCAAAGGHPETARSSRWGASTAAGSAPPSLVDAPAPRSPSPPHQTWWMPSPLGRRVLPPSVSWESRSRLDRPSIRRWWRSRPRPGAGRAVRVGDKLTCPVPHGRPFDMQGSTMDRAARRLLVRRPGTLQPANRASRRAPVALSDLGSSVRHPNRRPQRCSDWWWPRRSRGSCPAGRVILSTGRPACACTLLVAGRRPRRDALLPARDRPMIPAPSRTRSGLAEVPAVGLWSVAGGRISHPPRTRRMPRSSSAGARRLNRRLAGRGAAGAAVRPALGRLLVDASARAGFHPRGVVAFAKEAVPDPRGRYRAWVSSAPTRLSTACRPGR